MKGWLVSLSFVLQTLFFLEVSDFPSGKPLCNRNGVRSGREWSWRTPSRSLLCGCAQGGGIPVTLGTSLVGPCLLNQVRYSLLEKSGSEVVQRELSVQVSFKSFYGKLLKEEGEKELSQAGRML